MHWTALLEKKYFPVHARVIDDVSCVGCGYNLRHSRAAGSCPECGRPITDSLWALARPGRVARGLRSVGKSYLGLGALILAPFAFGGGTLAVCVLALVVVATAVIRAFAVGELRFRAELDHLPVIGLRVRVLWPLALLDVVLALIWAIMLPLVQSGATPSARIEMVFSVFAAWLCATFTVAGVAGWMGSALAAMLGYETVSRELRVQWMLIAAGPALAIAISVAGLVFLGLFGAPAGVFRVLAALTLLALMWLPAAWLTFAGMLHLANGAEQERETLDELVDAERTPGGLRRSSDDDLADIKVDP